MLANVLDEFQTQAGFCRQWIGSSGWSR